ncbi:ATP-binding protein, partial [Sulfurimonas sp.]|nr:ATP-binding protein [Sulfurimonas sp.]
SVVLFSKSDIHGNITHVSSALLELTGYTKKELLGNNHRIFKDEENKEELFTDLWDTITKKKVWNGELINKKKDGSSYWMQLTITPELDANGHITSYSAYRLDITDKKKLENEKLNTQRALEFKSKFLSNMSHEIRTPLNAIIGLLNVAQKTDLNEKQRSLLSKVTSSSDMLLGIINDILDISKIEAGKMTIEYLPFNIKDLISSVKNLMSVKIVEKNISFSVHYKNLNNFYFLGDSLRISQILNNLLGNAIKFTDFGEISVNIEMLKESIVRFEVKDSGIGLEDKQAEKLFEDFVQADMGTSRKYGGTGLGLSISKQLVKLMNGKIWVESVYGKGSTFIFEIPLIYDESMQDSEENLELELDLLESNINALEGKKILIAEDNKMNQMVVSMLLEDSQLELDFALDGLKAIEKFQANRYDLILMDIQMPNMNGYDATLEIRKLDANIPIIALSANVMIEDIEQAKNVGMNEYLAKPIEIEKLYKAILEYTT